MGFFNEILITADFLKVPSENKKLPMLRVLDIAKSSLLVLWVRRPCSAGK